MNSLLYVFLPCKKVYPTGITYLADFIHRRRPDVRQQILDLSLYPLGERAKALRTTVSSFQPELVCFSWRDIQIFSPHEGDASLEHAFNFYYASNPFKRIVASFQGLHHLYRYYTDIKNNLSYPWLVKKEFPSAQMMIGGGAFTAFADQLIEKLPEGIIGHFGGRRRCDSQSVKPGILSRGTLYYSLRAERFQKEPNIHRRCWIRSPLICPISLLFFPSTKSMLENVSGCRVSAAVRTTAPSVSIRISKGNGCGTDRLKMSCRIFRSTIISGGAPFLVYRRSVHYREGGLPAVYRNLRADYSGRISDRMVRLHSDFTDQRRIGETHGPIRRWRFGSCNYCRFANSSQQFAHGIQIGTPL